VIPALLALAFSDPVAVMRRMGRGALNAADARAREALRDDWLDEAYVAERDGNPNRARYLAYLAGRL
jgi:hypothetical protein